MDNKPAALALPYMQCEGVATFLHTLSVEEQVEVVKPRFGDRYQSVSATKRWTSWSGGGACGPASFTPATRSGTYVERMHHHSDFWNRVHECPNCARHVHLTREDRYRRHFATEPDGRLRLCPASGHAFAGVVAPGLHRLDL